jgi:hypothetical protein
MTIRRSSTKWHDAAGNHLRLTPDKRKILCLYDFYATQFWLSQSWIEGIMTAITTPKERREIEERAEYRQRMLVNALAASFITLLMISGYWMVITLKGVV